MKKLVASAVWLFLVMPVAAQTPSCPAWAQADTASWTCLTFGDSTGQSPAVIEDADSWAKVWAKKTGQANAPSVDFSREIVLISADGSLRARRLPRDGEQAAFWRQAAAEGQSKGPEAGARVAQALSGAHFALNGDGSTNESASPSMGGLSAFDGSLRDAVASPAAVLLGSGGLFIPAAQSSKAKAKTKASQQSDCTPGVDCPDNTPKPSQPNCTPGVDCPDDGGGNGGGGKTPLPPNYQPRPTDPPNSFPPRGNPNYYDDTVDVHGYWREYRSFFGAEESYGNWTHTHASADVARGGAEVGTQGTDYTATLRSDSERNVYRLYWRYVGRNCDPNDSSQCESWSVEYAWFYDRSESGSSSSITVEVHFRNDQTLLPWEKENIHLTYDGSQIGVDPAGAAFVYSVRGPIVDQQRGTAVIELTPTARVLRRPEADKVSLALVKGANGLQLVVDDSRDAFYAGETLEIAVLVKKDSGSFWHKDQVILERRSNGPLQVRVAPGQHPQASIDLHTSDPGKYYIKSWSFRRAQSKISSGDWVDRGQGNNLQL